jgi:carbon monoxide dehydrogenase subunit G
MARFESTNISESDVPVTRDQIWEIITSPDRLARLTPIIDRISANGDIWCWQLKTVSALGAKVTPSFTERMTFDEGHRLDFEHTPPSGSHERAGATGTYTLDDLPDGSGTHLYVHLTLAVELPLPRAASRAVEPIMAASMARTGQRFAENLYRELGLPGKPNPTQRNGRGEPVKM